MHPQTAIMDLISNSTNSRTAN